MGREARESWEGREVSERRKSVVRGDWVSRCFNILVISFSLPEEVLKVTRSFCQGC